MKWPSAVLFAAALCAGAMASLLAWVAWAQSQLPFNREGRFFDGLAVHHEQAVPGHAVTATFLAVVSVACAWRATRLAQRHRHERQNQGNPSCVS